MKVSLKQLKGDTFDIEVEPESNIGDLKAKIAELKPDYPADQQKLIYAGKVLADPTLMKDCGIKEGQFIVVMASKVKPPAGSAAAAPAPAEVAAAPAPVPAAAPAAIAPSATPAAAGAGGETRAVLEQLRNHPQFAQMAALVAQNPSALPQLLPAIAQSNPGVVQAIMQNPEEFMQMLQEAAAGGGGGGAGGAGGGGGGDQRTVIHLSEDERAAIKRLADLGFESGAAAEAYLACDKNEEVAANFLFENGMNDGDGDASMVSMPGGGGGGAAPFPMMGQGGGGGGGGAGDEGGDGSDSAAVLAQLRDHPQFAQLAQMVLQNPQILPEIIGVVAQTNPEIERAIRENPQELMRLLQEATGGAGAVPGGAAGGAVPQPGGTMAPPGGMQLSEDERAAIARLTELGFSRNAALQAYLACDKNEELAANFLFESGGD